MSNIDNLGATVDLYILNHLMNPPNGKPCEFVMEVTNKTRADVKVNTERQQFGDSDLTFHRLCSSSYFYLQNFLCEAKHMYPLDNITVR